MYKIVIVRHGESTWNKKKLFTGWTDVPLTEEGKKQAKWAGKILKQKHYTFNLAYTSVLKRATKTLDIILKEMKLKIPVEKSWRLNERHYGALQGLHKPAVANKYGQEKVQIWRRSYDVRPPVLKLTDKRYPGFDIKYNMLTKSELPRTECLKDTVARVLPYWKREILPQLKKHKQIIIVASNNSMRALMKYIDKLSPKQIVKIDNPMAVPIVYEFDKKFKPIKHYYLGNKKEIERRFATYKGQTK